MNSYLRKLISGAERLYYESTYFRVLKISPEKMNKLSILDRPLDHNSRIIFLDIDNILNRADIFSFLPLLPVLEITNPEIKEFVALGNPQFIIENKLLNLLIELQKSRSDIFFVIISEWRKYFSYSTLKNFLSPLNICGIIDPSQDKIPGILSWWDTFAKDRLTFSPQTALILDDNIINGSRRYYPECGLELVHGSPALDRLFKDSLWIPLSPYGDATGLRESDITEIKSRLF